MIRTYMALALSAALAAASPLAAHATIVRANTAVASSQFTGTFDGRAINTINGSGMPSPACPNSAHAGYATGNHWTTAAGTSPTTQFITWGFNVPQTIDAVHIWNHLSTIPPAANPGYDVVRFDLTLLDASNTALLTLTNQPLLPDTATAQTLVLSSPVANVSSVRFNIKQTQSSTSYTGLAEVLFNSPLPDPADLNHDSVVDTTDLVQFLGLFGDTVTPGAPGDLNNDGLVDTADLVYFLGRFGQSTQCA